MVDADSGLVTTMDVVASNADEVRTSVALVKHEEEVQDTRQRHRISFN